MLDRLKSWITEYVRSVMESTIRVGVVSSTNPGSGTVRVELPDDDSLVSFDLRVLVRKTHRDQDYWMPDVGDQVLCLFLPFGLEQGFVLGAFYSRPDAVPVSSQDKRHVLFEDGTWLEYDRKSHILSGHIKGSVNALTVDLDAILEVKGNVQATVGKSVTLEVKENVDATVGKNLTAQVSQSAAVNAGTKIALTAPQISLLGNLSSSAAGGGAAMETKEADTDHTGSYKLTGDLQVNGNISATGNITADGDILSGGSNSNHHSH